MKRKIAALACVMGLVVAAGVLSAQDASAPPSTLAIEIESLEKEVASLSGTEKVEKATKKVNEMKTVLASTNELLEKVRSEEQDILKLNCINDKLAAIKGFLKVSEQSHDSLKLAVTAGDKQAENHHYTLVAIAGQKVGVLGEEAMVCAGEVLRFAEDTVVERTIDPNIALVDPILLDDNEYHFDQLMDRLPELTAFN